MACRRCGCRMVTKVGRSTPMLICSDCGDPVDQRETADLRRKRFLGAITLVGMAVVGASMLLLASMNELRMEGRLVDGAESRDDSSREGEPGEGRSLPDPSGLVDVPQSLPKPDAHLPQPTRPQGQVMSLSAQPGALPAQDDKNP